MTDWKLPEDDQLDPPPAMHGDRRRNVLEQIEAALLAERLQLEGIGRESVGSDPYNRAAGRGDAWGSRRR